MSAEAETEIRELLCELTPAELLQRGDAMADAELQIERLKLDRANLSAEIKAQREVRSELAVVIDSGTERRDVRCVWIEDFSKNCFRLIRQDTGEEVDTRAMTAADRQEDMFEDEHGTNNGRAHPDDDEFEDEEEVELRATDDDPEPEPRKPRARSRQPQPNA